MLHLPHLGHGKEDAEKRAENMKKLRAIGLFANKEGVFDDHLRMINTQMVLFSASGFILILLYNDICFDRDTLEFTESIDTCPEAFYFKLICWILYFIILARLLTYYWVWSARAMHKWGYTDKFTAFRRSDLWKQCLLEIFLNALMPVPASNDRSWQPVNNVLVSISFVRIYLLIRAFRDYSAIYRQRHDIRHRAGFIKFASGEDRIGSYSSVFKAYFYSYTFLCVGIIFLLSLLFLAYMMFLTEREFWVISGSRTWVKITDDPSYTVDVLTDLGYSRGPFISFGVCCWYIIVTMTTTGYGDYFPYDWQGRLYGSVAVLGGIVLVSLIVGVIANKIAPTEFQSMVIDWMNKRYMTEQVDRYAAILIQTAWREHRKLLLDEKRVQNDRHAHIKNSIRPWLKQLRAAKQKLGVIAQSVADKEKDQTEEVQEAITNLKLRVRLILDRIPKPKDNNLLQVRASSVDAPLAKPSPTFTTLHLPPGMKTPRGDSDRKETDSTNNKSK